MQNNCAARSNVGELDPIFAVIAFHRRAFAGLSAACADDRPEPVVNAYSHVECRAKGKLYRCVPGTPRGAVALIRYILATADFEDVYDREWKSLLDNLSVSLREVA